MRASMKRIALAIILVTLVVLGITFLLPSQTQTIDPNRRYIACTIQPLALLLRELAPPERSVFAVADPGQSPHTFSPTPSDAQRCQQALVLISVAPSVDAWAEKLPVDQHIFALSSLPQSARLRATEHAHHHGEADGHDHHHHGHDHGAHGADDLADIDPHFWLDPQRVADVLPGLAAALAKHDPAFAEHYKSQAEVLRQEYLAFSEQMVEATAKLRQKALIQFHPSMAYLLDRIGMIDGGVVNEQVGSNPTPKALEQLLKQSTGYDLIAVCTEPQLPRAAAERVAEQLRLPLISIDPLGARAKNMRQFWLETVNTILAVNEQVGAKQP